MSRSSRARIFYTLLILVLALIAGSRAASWLVINDPQRSDVILVLAGETSGRPSLGLHLLMEQYATKLVVDVPAEQQIFGHSAPELAERWIQTLTERSGISICPIHGLSTKDESREAAQCIARVGGQRVLLVTSDFHTRRALSTFRHENPNLSFSVAGVHDAQDFGPDWWTNRQWAKTTWYEWTRLAWWQCVDRWL